MGETTMMLKIKRVPTFVSNCQADEAKGCGRNCLEECCIQRCEAAVVGFKWEKESGEGRFYPMMRVREDSLLASSTLLFLGSGKSGCKEGCSAMMSQCVRLSFGLSFQVLVPVIPGEHGFIAQLNEGRHLQKRPTEFRVDKVLQPFDQKKFNFTKIGQEEILFQFEASECGENEFLADAPIEVENRPSVIAINVSPIEYGHVLLIPHIFECLSQRIDDESFLLALHMAVEAANPYFRLGYNSLGAFATINHLHFQAYYLAMPFPIEKVPRKEVVTLNNGVKISRLLQYPVRGLVFEGEKTMEDLSKAVSDSCICLQNNNIPHNVLISDCGKRIFLVPPVLKLPFNSLLRCYAEKQALGEVGADLLDTQVNPAVWEISGHMVLKRKKDFEEATEENAWRLLAEVSLSEERFQEVNTLIFESLSCNENTKSAQLSEPAESQPLDDDKEAACPAMITRNHECTVQQ